MNESLCRALNRAALSEIDVAARLEVDPKTVRRWMGGRLPYLRHRVALCVLLGASQVDLWPQLRDEASWPDEVQAIYPHIYAVPNEVWLRMLGSARNEVDVLAGAELLAADGLAMNAMLIRRVRHGARVRICVGEQDALSGPEIHAVHADRDTSGVAWPALPLIAHLHRLGSAVRVHEGVLYHSICRADNELLVVQHTYGLDAVRGPAVLLNNGKTGLFAVYARSLDQVWAAARPLGPLSGESSPVIEPDDPSSAPTPLLTGAIERGAPRQQSDFSRM